jgi:histone acetyltransferase (RNA polymerase elongator complex component)
MVEEMLRGLREMGVSPGVVLWPGLPAASFEVCVRDAERVAPLVDSARLHPTLVLEGSDLQRRHLDGLYRPLEVGEAVTVCRASDCNRAPTGTARPLPDRCTPPSAS